MNNRNGKLRAAFFAAVMIMAMICLTSCTKEAVNPVSESESVLSAAKTAEAAAAEPADGGMPEGEEYVAAEKITKEELINRINKNMRRDEDSDSDADEDVFLQEYTVKNNVIEDVSYVMIYNPLVCYEDYDDNLIGGRNLSTGNLSSQIITGMNRAGLEREDFINKDMDGMEYPDMSEMDFSQGEVRAGLDPVYSYGDTAEFFCGKSSENTRRKEKFTCAYEGKYCYVWTLGKSVNKNAIKQMGEEFDTISYPVVVEEMRLGKPRFTENGGKVNILVYEMEDCWGFVCPSDCYTEKELGGKDKAIQKKRNAGHAIINISDDLLNEENRKHAPATMAHELQHLSCAAKSMENNTSWLNTWLDEMMAQGACDVASPGYLSKYDNEEYYLSDSIKKGHSMYSFSEAGRYGRVGMFYNYLTYKDPSESIPANIHRYWAKSRGEDLTAGKALVRSVSSDQISYLDMEYSYPDAINKAIGDEDDIKMSKMILDFYKESIEFPDFGISFEDMDELRAEMIYTEKAPLNIEPGGRVIIATSNGSYQIPENADPMLVYYGFSDDFYCTTGPVYKK